VAGEKLVVLEDMVIDISTFAYAHPGGAFLLEHNIGSDIGKFFYGAYALDQNSNTLGSSNVHVHSNIARKIAISHVVGVLEKPF
jgi:cytochrome b involved in lipid metabolism